MATEDDGKFLSELSLEGSAKGKNCANFIFTNTPQLC
jgi:hypothetical protein